MDEHRLFNVITTWLDKHACDSDRDYAQVACNFLEAIKEACNGATVRFEDMARELGLPHNL